MKSKILLVAALFVASVIKLDSQVTCKWFTSKVVACVKGIINGTIGAKPYQSFAGNAMMSTYGRASVAFDPENL